MTSPDARDAPRSDAELEIAHAAQTRDCARAGWAPTRTSPWHRRPEHAHGPARHDRWRRRRTATDPPAVWLALHLVRLLTLLHANVLALSRRRQPSHARGAPGCAAVSNALLGGRDQHRMPP